VKSFLRLPVFSEPAAVIEYTDFRFNARVFSLCRKQYSHRQTFYTTDGLSQEKLRVDSLNVGEKHIPESPIHDHSRIYAKSHRATAAGAAQGAIKVVDYE